MTIRRIFAGSIGALLLSVTSLATACDVSCAFASMSSDCHAEQTESQNLAPGSTAMGGMAMAGMTMPGMVNGDYQQEVSPLSHAKASHPSIGEMGPCERQSCDNGSAILSKTSRSGDSHFHSILAVTEIARADGALTLFRDARDDIEYHYSCDGSPLHLSLRI